MDVEIEGRIVVPRSPEEVAPTLGQIQTLASCVPGMQEIRASDGETFEGEMTLELPFARLPSKVDGRLTEQRPDHMKFEVRGRPLALAGTFRADVELRWDPDEEGTLIRYRLYVSLQGRLASLGEAMVRATSKAKSQEFEQALAALLAAS